MFELYRKEDWKKLEELFKTHNLNKVEGIIWSPANGGYNTRKIFIKASDKNPVICDRYQFKFDYTDFSDDKYKGLVFSPMENGTPLAFDKRALPGVYEGYYEIKIVKDLPFEVEESIVIPWFGKEGKGIQYKLPEGTKWSDLIRDKYVVITPKSKP